MDSRDADVRSGFLLTARSRDVAGRAEIELWLATEDGPARLRVQGERPVFFVTIRDRELAIATLQRVTGRFETRALDLETFAGEPVTGCYFDAIQDAYRARDALSARGIETHEADIRLHERFLMERFVRGSLEFVGQPDAGARFAAYTGARIKPSACRPPLRVVSLDIECALDGELYSVGLAGDGVETVIMIGAPQPAATAITWVRDERALLQALEESIAAADPDVIIGWNVIDFDCQVLVRRADRHRLRLKLGRGGTALSWRRARNRGGKSFVSLPGRVVIDGIDALRTATYHFEDFSLETVASRLLGRGKLADDVHDRVEEITRNFREDKPALAAYNLEDCRLVLGIFEQTRLLDFLCLRSQLTGLALGRVGGSVAAFTNLYLPRLHRAGYVAPNLPADGGLASPGGYVMDSIPGLFRHVLVLDFKSLYPSIIRTFKIDPLGLIEGLKAPEHAIPGFLGGAFSRDEHLLPSIITDLWRQRDEAKRAKDAPRSQAIKILMNSFYGVLGSGGCRFYDQRLASSITMRGHEILQETAEWIREAGYQVIYGDTDSIFVQLPETLDDAGAEAIGRDLERRINARWRKTLEAAFGLKSELELEFETHYRRFHMPTMRGSSSGSKKRYAGLVGHGDSERLVFKGMETVRTDWTALARAFQRDLYEAVFHDRDPVPLVLTTVRATLAGQRDDDLVYHKRLRRRLEDYVRNVPPHVRAARIAQERRVAAGRASSLVRINRIAYVITTAGPEPVEYREHPIDYDHYVTAQLRPVADAVLPLLGLSFDDLTDRQLALL